MKAMKRRHRKLAVVTISSLVAVAVVLFAIQMWTATPHIRYEVMNGYSGFHSILEITPNGDYSLQLLHGRGGSWEVCDGKVTINQALSIKKSLLTNLYFTLPKDLSDHSMTDNSTEELEVRLGVIKKVIGGYGVRNPRFRNIAKELETLIASHN